MDLYLGQERMRPKGVKANLDLVQFIEQATFMKP